MYYNENEKIEKQDLNGIDAMVSFILNDKKIINKINEVNEYFINEEEKQKHFEGVFSYIKEDLLKNILIQILVIFEKKNISEIDLDDKNFEKNLEVFENHFLEFSKGYLENFLIKYKENFQLFFIEKLKS